MVRPLSIAACKIRRTANGRPYMVAASDYSTCVRLKIPCGLLARQSKKLPTHRVITPKKWNTMPC